MDEIITSTPSINSTLKPISKVAKENLFNIDTIKTNVSSPSNNNYWSKGNIITVGIIILILCLLGVNIFTYLAKGTDMVSWFLGNFINTIPSTTKGVVQNTLQGINVGTDLAANTVKGTSNILERELSLKQDKLWQARDKGFKQSVKDREIDGINLHPEHEPGYMEGPEDDNIQEKHKPGYCYIGTDRGYRSCIKVGARDNCESKKIFPTMDVCINPSLRE